MVIRSLGFFLVEVSAGTTLLLAFFPTRPLGKGFFALHGLVAFAALLLAAIVWPGGSSAVRAASVGLLALYTLLSRIGRQRPARILLLCSAAGQFWLLAGIAQELDSVRWGWIFAGSALGSLLFGSVLL